MEINFKGLVLLERFEGLKLEAYQDGHGIWTIGYGSTANVTPGMKITEAQAIDRLKADLKRTENGVESGVYVPMNPNEFSALVCFAYNVGVGAFQRSTLCELLNHGERFEASQEFLKWNKIQGKVVPGLTRRRLAEQALFLSTEFTG